MSKVKLPESATDEYSIVPSFVGSVELKYMPQLPSPPPT